MRAATSIVHHDFELTAEEFRARLAWPEREPIDATVDWTGEYASQSPLNAMTVERRDGGAAGTERYLALHGNRSDQFYAEATPRWYRPRQALDLRDTRATLYLKAITPIAVATGYRPYLFIDDYCETTRSYCGWYAKHPLQVGSDWMFNAVDLCNDKNQWVRYSHQRPLSTVLARVGFIGVMYLRGNNPRGVGASGILGIDEFRYNLPR